MFSKSDEKQIIAAIKAAELMTSGEICVHLLQKSGDDILEAAQKAFIKLGLANTQDRNGVLFVLAIKDKTFAILGDLGIHEKVGQEFWDALRDQLSQHFKRGDYAQGLIASINECGRQLKKHFPHQKNDINELSDSITNDNEGFGMWRDRDDMKDVNQWVDQQRKDRHEQK